MSTQCICPGHHKDIGAGYVEWVPEPIPVCPAEHVRKPGISLRDYIRRDLAYSHGIDRETLALLDKIPKHSRPATHRQWDIYADKAEIAALDWIIGNAPGAIPHLRAAGLYIPSFHDPKDPN